MTVITTHYDGTVECEFDPVAHVYRIRHWYEAVEAWSDWAKVNGVTNSILVPKDWLAAWAVKVGAEAASEAFLAHPSVDMGEAASATKVRYISDVKWLDLVKLFKGAYRKRRDDAADVGTRVHAWCEQYALALLDRRTIPLPEDPQERVCAEQFLRWLDEHKIKVVRTEQRLVSVAYNYAGTADLVCQIGSHPVIVDIKTSNQLSIDYRLQLAAYALAFREEFGYRVERGVLRLPKDGAPYEYQAYSNPDWDEETFLNSLKLARWVNINKEKR